MAPHEFVEIRLVCNADYLDPQLKVKLHQIKDKLREILHTGRRRFALKKVQPWNSVKVTFDIPKEAADRLRLLAVQGNLRLVELGILSVEIVGQSNAIVVTKTSTTNNSINNKELTTKATEEKNDDSSHRTKRMKIENENDSTNKTTMSSVPNVATATASSSNGLVHEMSTHYHPHYPSESWTNANNYKIKKILRLNRLIQRQFETLRCRILLMVRRPVDHRQRFSFSRSLPVDNSD